MATAVSPAAKNKGKCGAFICVMGFVVLQFKLWPDKYADIVIYRYQVPSLLLGVLRIRIDFLGSGSARKILLLWIQAQNKVLLNFATS